MILRCGIAVTNLGIPDTRLLQLSSGGIILWWSYPLVELSSWCDHAGGRTRVMILFLFILRHAFDLTCWLVIICHYDSVYLSHDITIFVILHMKKTMYVVHVLNKFCSVLLSWRSDPGGKIEDRRHWLDCWNYPLVSLTSWYYRGCLFSRMLGCWAWSENV